MKYSSQVWSVILHGILAVLWYYYSDFIFEYINFLNLHWLINTVIILVSMTLFAFLYKVILPKKYNLTVGWLVGFFPVLSLMMFFVY